MQFFEVLFLLVLAVGIVRLLLGPIHPRLAYSTIAVVGLGVMVLGVVTEGFRWQMIPAYVGFGVLLLASLKKSETRPVWRALGAVPLLLLLSASAVLTHELPMLSLPEPSGPYAVGTFEYSITDDSRKERYSPTRNRELYVEVWYPADKGASGDFPVRTLFQELYEGDYTQRSFLFGYLRHVPTHSHVHASVAAPDRGPFPVLLFNHALELGFTSQNQLLMEHLASHGYVIFSIAHPYQSAKVNLDSAGTVSTAGDYPSDMNLPPAVLPRGVVGTIYEASHDWTRSRQSRKFFRRWPSSTSRWTRATRKRFLVRRSLGKSFTPIDTSSPKSCSNTISSTTTLQRIPWCSIGSRIFSSLSIRFPTCRRRSPGLRNRSTPADSAFSACRLAAEPPENSARSTSAVRRAPIWMARNSVAIGIRRSRRLF